MVNASVPHYLLFCESERSVLDNGGPLGRWRFVLEQIDGDSLFEASDHETESDETRLDLLAIVRGLEALDQPSRVTLFTGNRQISHGFRFGLGEWRQNDWHWEQFGRMQPVRNSDLWRRIDNTLKFHQLQCRRWRFNPSPSFEHLYDEELGSEAEHEEQYPVVNARRSRKSRNATRWSFDEESEFTRPLCG